MFNQQEVCPHQSSLLHLLCRYVNAKLQSIYESPLSGLSQKGHCNDSASSCFIQHSSVSNDILTGTASLWNFIPLHMKSLGLSPAEIGLILGVPQFFGGFFTVLAGKCQPIHVVLKS